MGLGQSTVKGIIYYKQKKREYVNIDISNTDSSRTLGDKDLSSTLLISNFLGWNPMENIPW